MQLETERLVLRVLSSNHADEVLHFYEKNKNIFEKWEPSRVPTFYTNAFHCANLSLEFNQILQRKYLRYWIFEKSNPSTIIGSVCFHNLIGGPFQSCSISYKTDCNHLQKGYAFEASKAALDVIFKDYALHRVEAYISPDNTISQKLINKLGFVYEGVAYSSVKLLNQWQDHLRYSLTNPING